MAIAPQQKLPLQSGDTLTFGALKCRVSFGGTSEVSPPLLGCRDAQCRRVQAA